MCKDGSTCFVFCPDPPENTTCTNTLKTPQDTSQEGEETEATGGTNELFKYLCHYMKFIFQSPYSVLYFSHQRYKLLCLCKPKIV